MAGLTTSCNGRVWSGYHANRCSRAATTRDETGKGWCWQHDPSRKEAKLAAVRTQMKARREIELKTGRYAELLLRQLGVKGRVNWNFGEIRDELVISFEEAQKLANRLEQLDPLVR